MNNKKIILASGSQKRLDILKSMLIVPDYIIVPDIPEVLIEKEKPKDMSIRVAKAKGEAVLQRLLDDNSVDRNSILIAADTVQCRGSIILDKALTDDDVRAYITTMNGKNARVYTTTYIVDVATGRSSLKTSEARLKIKYLQREEIEFYISTKCGLQKAGGFSIGEFAGCFVEKIVGSYTAVLGLPSLQVYNTLRSFGYKFTTSIQNNIRTMR